MATPAARPWYVYVLRCADGSLYAGATTDLGRRHARHEAGTASRYTRSRRPTRLVYWEAHPDRGATLRREAAIKALPRADRLILIRRRRPKAA
jgi:predicted GIY-YIG superfamily endonuclease